MTMGSASTMACLVEAMGIALPYNATIPAVDARRGVLAHETGRLIVRMAREDVRLSKILTRQAFENAMCVLGAIGGSTNAVLHLLALAGRLGIPLELADFDRRSSEVPLLVDLQPSGRFLMEDLHYAGGLPAVMKELGPLLHVDAPTASGKTDRRDFCGRGVLQPRSHPHGRRARRAPLPASGCCMGNLCPGGAVMKPSAASQSLLTHRGRAVVFESIEDLHERIDDPALDVDANSILVLKGCGPQGLSRHARGRATCRCRASCSSKA